MSDSELEQLFSIKDQQEPKKKLQELISVFPEVEKSLKRKGVTKESVWRKYYETYPDGYRETQFRNHYNQWSKHVNSSMHIDHKAGDKMYVDYAGEHLQIVNDATGEIKKVEVFAAILGASQNATKLFAMLKMTKADGSYLREISRIEKQDLLILDDFGIQPLDSQSRSSLMEIIEDRHGKHSTIMTSQLPVKEWYDVIGEKTLSDAILDRLVHDAHRIELIGESLRRKQNPNYQREHQDIVENK